MDNDLLAAVQQQESNNNPNAVSKAGAVGLMQTMPATLTNPGYGVTPAKDKSPEELARVGRDYLNAMVVKYGDVPTALMAYNWGPGNVDAWLKTGMGANGQPMPAETQQYPHQVLAKTQNPMAYQQGDELGQMLAMRAMGKPVQGALQQTSQAQTDELGQMLAMRAQGKTIPTQDEPQAPSSSQEDAPGYAKTFGVSALGGLAKSFVAIEQLFGKTASTLGDISQASAKSVGMPTWLGEKVKAMGDAVSNDANDRVRSINQLQAENGGAANPKTAFAGNVAGAVANPVNYVFPMGAGATTLANIGKAALGGSVIAGATTPVDPDSKASFAEQKAAQMAMGGIAGAAVQPLANGLSFLFNKVISAFGNKGAEVSAQDVVSKAAQDAGIDLSKAAPDAVQEMQTVVQHALDKKQPVNADAVENLLRAKALPVPVPMTAGQATRDPLLYARELNMRSLPGGEAITNTLGKQESALIANLDAMGAANAPLQIDAGKAAIGTVSDFLKGVKAKVDNAYAAVRNSAGQAVQLDGGALADNIDQALSPGRLDMMLPNSIKTVVEEIRAGKMPITPQELQNLDQVWGAAQRGADGGTIKAIGAARSALSDAPLASGESAQTQAMYEQARSLAKQRFQLLENNPAFKAVNDGVEPDRFIQKYVLGGNASEVGNLMSTLKATAPETYQAVKNAVMDHIKTVVTAGRSDETAKFSEAQFQRFFQPQMLERLKQIFTQDEISTLMNLKKTAENIKVEPAGAAVNRSNTAATAKSLNDQAINGGAISGLLNAASNVPKVGIVAEHLAGIARKRNAASLSQHMTQNPLGPPTPSEPGSLAALLQAGAANAGGNIATPQPKR